MWRIVPSSAVETSEKKLLQTALMNRKHSLRDRQRDGQYVTQMSAAVNVGNLPVNIWRYRKGSMHD